MRGGLEGQRFVRSLLVVLAPEAIEGVLLRAPVGGWRTGSLLLQGAVHAFVPPVLLGMAGLNAFRPNAQLQPPHRQARQSAQRARCEGRAVVATNGLRHAVLA